ncbi:MAG: hypothetical protein V4671_26295, partial [Armatimonadota bacterium]
MPFSRLSPGIARLIRDTVLFIVVMSALRFGVLFARQYFVFDAPPWWPLSIFNPRSPTLEEMLVAAAVALVFFAAMWRLERTQYRNLAEVTVFGMLLILGSSALQGPVYGFRQPTAGGTIQYYHDAKRYSGAPTQFLHDFNAIQPTLGDHGRTHPPGAVLLFRTLVKVTGDSPAAISVLIAAAAALISAGSFRLLLEITVPVSSRNSGVFLLLLLPAVQVYYCASLDAIITSLLLATVGLFLLPPTLWRTAGTGGCLVAASFLTFGFVWVAPLLLIVELNRWDRGRSLLRLFLLFAGFLAFYSV